MSRQTQATDDLVSVTVRKADANQKAGISLVERQGAVFVTKVTEHGLFHDTEIEMGDLVLSMGGKRLKKGEGAREVIKHITSAKTTVTIVVKKANRKARRGARSLSPMSQRRRMQPQKLYKKAFNRNADGSLKFDLDPRVNKLQQHDKQIHDDKLQIVIKANKLFGKQDIGVMLTQIDKMIFISGLTPDSVFGDTELDVGDRVVSVNEMNFMGYGDANYAKKLIEKATKEVVLVVEKGHKNFKKDRHTDPKHNKARVIRPDAAPYSPGAVVKSPVSPGFRKTRIQRSRSLTRDAGRDSDVIANILGKGSDHSASRKAGTKTPTKKVLKRGNKPKSFSGKVPSLVTSDSSDYESPLEDVGLKTRKVKSKAFKAKQEPESDEESLGEFAAANNGRLGSSMSALGALRGPLNRGSLSKLAHDSMSKSTDINFMHDQYGDDYMKVTLQKRSEADPGITLEKTEGKFLLKSVPLHDRRLAIGMQVLAINGVMNINTPEKAADLIKRTESTITLILDNSPPTDRQLLCPCCGDKMRGDGKHLHTVGRQRTLKGRGRSRADEGSVMSSSVAESVTTAKASNQTPGGRPLPPAIPETSGHYNYDEYDSDSDEEEEKPHNTKRVAVSRYKANDKFMVRVKKTDSSAPLLSLLDHKTCIYVSKVFSGGPFYSTPLTEGDKILSINGRKVSLIKNAANALAILEERDAISLFLLRPDPNDKDYQEAKLMLSSRRLAA